MERKIGEIFTYKGKTYQVVPGYGCENCGFKDLRCNMRTFSEVRGTCDSSMRKDNNNVIFKKVKKHMNIKNNQLTINIPEGMEIDLENSDLTKGIIKFRDKWLTLERIYGSTKEDCYLTNSCGIRDCHNNKLVAIANLMDIARYFNGDWKYKVNGGERGYMIAYDGSIKESPYYKVNVINPTTDVYYGNPIFENDVDAQAVIDNPNFRNILDAIYKN